jgi:hypothetical protein
MVDRPVIFSAPMVQALLLEAREPGTGKSQTRRSAWRTLPDPLNPGDTYERGSHWKKVKPGDRLWVRESIALRDLGGGFPSPVFFADGAHVMEPGKGKASNHYWPGKKAVPSIHMPRWASRLTLTVTGVKVERLNEISEQDCEREGCVWDQARKWWHVPGVNMPSGAPVANATARDAFACLWDTVNGSGAWLANPEVVAVTFTVALRNIDAVTPWAIFSPTSPSPSRWSTVTNGNGTRAPSRRRNKPVMRRRPARFWPSSTPQGLPPTRQFSPPWSWSRTPTTRP